MQKLLLGVVFVAACTADAAAPPVTSPVSTSTPAVVASTASTAPPTTLPALEIRLSAVEARAAGSEGVRVTFAGGSVTLVGDEPAGVSALPGTDLRVAYSGGPSWIQTLEAGAVIEQPWRQPPPAGRDPIALAWQVNGDAETYSAELDVATGLDVASPLWWNLDPAGALIEDSDPAYVVAAAERGVELWPYVVNGFDPERTRAAIGTSERRLTLAQAISDSAETAGAAGVNVDFESFDSTERDHFTAFMHELTRLVHGWGGVTSVDITVLTSDFATSHEASYPVYNRRELATATDYLVLMAYDEHSTLRPYGPTASIDWVEDGLLHPLRYVDPHQVILGIPFYSRLWTPGDPTARAVTITRVVELASEGKSVFDDQFGLDRVTLDDGRFFWVEGYEALSARLELVDEHGLAGWAAWRLGFDSPDLWRQVTLPGVGS